MLVEVLLFVALLFLLWKGLRKPPGLPPGRWGLPLLGYIPFTTKSMEEQVMELHEKHGGIVVWRMGTQVMVFLNDYKLIREAFSRPEITDRPNWETLRFFENPPLGIGTSNGLVWHNNRRFTLRHLRNLGMGKSKLVPAIQKQMIIFRDSLNKNVGIPGGLPHQLNVSIINILWEMVASKQFDAKDARLKTFIQYLTDITVYDNKLAIKDFLPWLQYLIPDFLFKKITKEEYMRGMLKNFFSYFYEEIAKHRASFDPDDPKDLIDNYLIEMDSKKDDPLNSCSEKDLVFVLFNLFFAGIDTSTTTFTWLCCYLAAYPQVQRKLQAEIDEVLPGGEVATLAEKPRMPYTEAVVNEAMRMSSLVNFGVQHMSSTETQLGGYTIPKGTVFNTSTFALHVSERHWDNPNAFLPERWLDGDGKFSMKKEGFLPFGVGKRTCVGENLARMELFFLVAIVFQKFSIAPSPGKKIDLKPDLSLFFFRKPNYNEFVFTNRKQ